MKGLGGDEGFRAQSMSGNKDGYYFDPAPVKYCGVIPASVTIPDSGLYLIVFQPNGADPRRVEPQEDDFYGGGGGSLILKTKRLAKGNTLAIVNDGGGGATLTFPDASRLAQVAGNPCVPLGGDMNIAGAAGADTIAGPGGANASFGPWQSSGAGAAGGLNVHSVGSRLTVVRVGN